MKHTLVRATIAVALTVPLAPRPVAAMLFVAPECWGAEDRSSSFNGQMTTNGGTIVEQIGRRGSERVVQTHFGDLWLCMVTRGFDGERDDPPSRWPLRSERVILETRMPDDVRTLEINDGRVTYTVNGAVRPADADAREWRDNLLALLDVAWDLGELRGRESLLRGQISSIQGERSGLQGVISSYRGQVSSMQGEISSLRGQVSSMRGEISSIRGSHTRDADADARVREIERRIDTFDVETKVAEVERRIREFDVESKVARIQRRLDALDVDNRVGDIEAEIRAMDVPGRTRDLEERRNEALARLRQTLR